MQVLSVNISDVKTVTINGEPVQTGIYKEPVQGRRVLRRHQVEGDRQANLDVHGGEFMAAYVYQIEAYFYWAHRLERFDFTMGQFGENFTVSGLPDTEVCIGDTYRFGTALVEVTKPRVPCFKLAHKMDLPNFPAQMTLSAMTGFYLRVLEEGDVGASDRIELVERHPAGLTVTDLFKTAYHDRRNMEGIERALTVSALPPDWRAIFEERLGRL